MAFSLMQIVKFVLIMSRFVGFVIVAPFFSSKNIPKRVKVALMFFFTVFVYNFVDFPTELTFSPILTSILMIKELLIGFAMGYLMELIFTAIQLAGRLIDYQMGFMMANLVDPQYGGRVPLTGQMGYAFMVLVFLLINGHHFLIKALIQSFSVFPVAILELSLNLTSLINFFAQVFMLGIKLSLPVVGALFIATIGLGIIARTVPQMNVFVVGMPAKILLGVFVLAIAMPVCINLLDNIFNTYINEGLRSFYELFGG